MSEHQCPSCGGFCKPFGCERASAPPRQRFPDILFRLQEGDGSSPDHKLLMEAADCIQQQQRDLQYAVEVNAALIADAKRYRWLRENEGIDFEVLIDHKPNWLPPWTTENWNANTDALVDASSFAMMHQNPRLLYTTPPQRKPLTPDQVFAIADQHPVEGFDPDIMAFARAIEAAHGIKE